MFKLELVIMGENIANYVIKYSNNLNIMDSIISAIMILFAQYKTIFNFKFRKIITNNFTLVIYCPVLFQENEQNAYYMVDKLHKYVKAIEPQLQINELIKRTKESLETIYKAAKSRELFVNSTDQILCREADINEVNY